MHFSQVHFLHVEGLVEGEATSKAPEVKVIVKMKDISVFMWNSLKISLQTNTRLLMGGIWALRPDLLLRS